jgi:ribosomal protein S18 acetylase RimI-like enzyme
MIRRATHADADAVGRVFVAARDAMPYLPRIDDDARPRLGSLFVERHRLWVWDEDGEIAGFVGVDHCEVSHLYVAPPAQRRGIGTALLQHAKTVSPERLELWVFQKNDDARRFYERHGFRLVRLTDGADNMEREPDALYAWDVRASLEDRGK